MAPYSENSNNSEDVIPPTNRVIRNNCKSNASPMITFPFTWAIVQINPRIVKWDRIPNRVDELQGIFLNQVTVLHNLTRIDWWLTLMEVERKIVKTTGLWCGHWRWWRRRRKRKYPSEYLGNLIHFQLSSSLNHSLLPSLLRPMKVRQVLLQNSCPHLMWVISLHSEHNELWLFCFW